MVSYPFMTLHNVCLASIYQQRSNTVCRLCFRSSQVHEYEVNWRSISGVFRISIVLKSFVIKGWIKPKSPFPSTANLKINSVFLLWFQRHEFTNNTESTQMGNYNLRFWAFFWLIPSDKIIFSLVKLVSSIKNNPRLNLA